MTEQRPHKKLIELLNQLPRVTPIQSGNIDSIFEHNKSLGEFKSQAKDIFVNSMLDSEETEPYKYKMWQARRQQLLAASEYCTNNNLDHQQEQEYFKQIYNQQKSKWNNYHPRSFPAGTVFLVEYTNKYDLNDTNTTRIVTIYDDFAEAQAEYQRIITENQIVKWDFPWPGEYYYEVDLVTGDQLSATALKSALVISDIDL